MLRNTTDIPDKLIAIAMAFGMPDGLPNDHLAAVHIKNKRHGKVGGRWGWYYPGDKAIILIVPRRIIRPHTYTKHHCKREIIIGSRVDFLVAVMAHEMRHAWQYLNWNTPASRWKLDRTRIGKYAREVDAELFEIATLDRWRKEVNIG